MVVVDRAWRCEIAEILMLYVSLHVFNPETIKDQFTDIFVGDIRRIIWLSIYLSKV